MEADLRGFHHQTTQGESLRVAPRKRNNYCVLSEGLTFVITGAENRSRGILMLFKDELIISLRQSKVRQATGPPRRAEMPSKALRLKSFAETGSLQTDVFASLPPFVWRQKTFASLESSSFGGCKRVPLFRRRPKGKFPNTQAAWRCCLCHGPLVGRVASVERCVLLS